ncbi:MAG: hypothetical protein ACTSYI_08885 [Promethearchaeota archaeon]
MPPESISNLIFPFVGILLLLILLAVLTIIIIVKVLAQNKQRGEWDTYPNPDLHPEHHHTPYMGFPAHATARPTVPKYCPNCGMTITKQMSFRLGHGKTTFCEKCGQKFF